MCGQGDRPSGDRSLKSQQSSNDASLLQSQADRLFEVMENLGIVTP